MTTLFEPTEKELRRAGSLKWTGIRSDDDHETIGAWIAEMDFGTAPAVLDRLKTALDEGLLGYLPAWAPVEAARALSSFHQQRHGWRIDPEHVRAAGSVLEALEATISRLSRPGSPVIVPTPAYMPFLTLPVSLGRRVIEVPSLHTPGGKDGQSWRLNLDGIAEALAAGAGTLILCNPWNPTGRVFSEDELTALNRVVRDHDVIVFSDEIHSPLTLGDPTKFTSYASLGPEFAAHTVTAMAASKGWNIAGLPSAQIVLPDDRLRNLWDVQTPGFVGRPTTLGTVAAITAYEQGAPWLDNVLSYITENLDYLGEALQTTDIDYSAPEGSYVTWLGWDAYAFPTCPASILRNTAFIGVNCGEDMGAGYKNWTRVNSAMPHDLWRRTVDGILKVADQAAR